MKRRFIERRFRSGNSLFFLILCIVFFFNCSTAQNTANEIITIENTVTKLYSAMVAKNKYILEDLTDEQLTYGHSSGIIENKSQYVDGVLNGVFQFSSITPKEQTVSVTGNVGVVRHVFEAQGTNKGKSADVRIGCLLIFKKTGRWKLLARQAYKL